MWDFTASEHTLRVPDGVTDVTFKMPLESGPSEIQSWWIDADGNRLAGAYYLTAERIQ